MSWLDLHMHTRYSDDGDFTPAALMKMCREAGIRTAAIADHNSAKGIAEGLAAANTLGLQLIPAIELDCTFSETGLHVLGYGIDHTFLPFETLEEDIIRQEQTASKDRLRLVREMDIIVDDDRINSLAVHGVITGEMIAEAAIEDLKNHRHPLLQPYFSGGSRSDNPYVNFYWDFCAQGKPAYAPIKYITLTEAVKLIHSAGGIAVLAHPGNNIGMNEDLLAGIIGEDVVGVEAYSSYHSAEITEFYLLMAAKYNLLVTAGSDFHGKTKPAITLGNIPCPNEDELHRSLTARL